MLYVIRSALVFISAILLVSFSFGQTITRQDNETVEMFANRLKPDSTEIAHPTIETTALDTAQKIIVAFYRKTVYEVKQMSTYVDHNQYDILVGYLFVSTDGNNYKSKLIDTLLPDGGDPEILAIFFANADKDKSKELVVLCKYDQRHYDYDGAFYETFIYNYTDGNIQLLEKLSRKFGGCDCGWRNGRTDAKYKEAKEIRAGLIKMGYRQ